jgi:thiosulfate reductase cytochrome b subunit
MARDLAQQRPAGSVRSLKGFHTIFAALFLAFLVLVLVAPLFNQNWRSLLPGAEGARSAWDGVRCAVYTVISQLS